MKKVFKDKFNHKFLIDQTKDNYKAYEARGSVTDAINIINYINKLDELTNVIDVGAHIGGVSVALGKKLVNSESSNLIAIEADPQNAIRIYENLLLNDINNFNVLNVGISQGIGKTYLTRFAGRNGWQTLSKNIGKHADGVLQEKVLVTTNTLLSVINFYQISDIDLIKIDIEGMELAALRSITSLLDGKIKKVIFEVNELTLSPNNIKMRDLIAFWDNLPYELYVVNLDGSLSSIDSINLSSVSFFDCLALYDKCNS